MLVSYDPALTMRQARKIYFEANKFGDNGGYDDKWVYVKLGPLPFAIPNTASRVRAVKVHDLHHILTGYDTNMTGEFEISAWEIAAGCKDFYAAWFLNLTGITGGLIIAPRRIIRAFARGLASQSLYGKPLDELLDSQVGQARARFIRSTEDAPKLGAKGAALLTLAALAGTVLGTVMLVALIPVVPFALAAKPA